MDPVATLRMIDDFVKADQHGDEVDEWCDDLRAWIRGGGFEPNWGAFPLGTSYYHCRAAAVKRGRAGETDTPMLMLLGAPTPEALTKHAPHLYSVLVCLLAELERDIESSKYWVTRIEAERAVLAVHTQA